jgi:hypothetical protein
MALPKLVTPEFETTIPSSKKKIKFRPFLVKEEKILYMALEGGNEDEIENSIIKVLEDCILADVDPRKLASYDVEYLFLQLRSKSVGELVELSLRHGADTDCDHRTPVQVDLNKVKVKFFKDHEYKININDELGMKLKDPTLSDLNGMTDTDYNNTIKLIANCVDMVYDKEDVYPDFTIEEATEFLLSMTQEQFKNIEKFFDTLPKLQHEIKWTCPECGKKDSVTVEGLQSFFT